MISARDARRRALGKPDTYTHIQDLITDAADHGYMNLGVRLKKSDFDYSVVDALYKAGYRVHMALNETADEIWLELDWGSSEF